MVAAHEGSRRVVTAANGAARRLGLRPGLTVAHARALVPGLAAVPADPAADRAGLARLGAWALRRYSPVVALDPPDGLWLDAAGCAHLFGGEAAMLADLLGHLAASGIAARAAVAPTWGAAHALARHGRAPAVVIAAGGERAALAPLPVAALRLARPVVDGLRRLGFERIGPLLDAPRAPLVRRFGPDLGRRLDQAVGLAAEPMEPLAAPAMPAEQLSFAEPIGLPGQLARAVADLAAALCRQVGDRGAGVRRLDLACHRVDGQVGGVRVRTSAPTRDPAHLARLLSERLALIDPGFGIDRMVLSAPLVEPLAAHQLASDLAGPGDATMGGAALAGLVDRLANRLGRERLYRIAPVESEVPERSGCRLPPLAPAGGRTWPSAWPRPTRLLQPPEPVDTWALLPDHPPVQFTWRGSRHRVARADGPERIFGEWWRREAESAAVRDYFQVEDGDGARFWLYRAGDGVDPATGSHRWFIHGLFG